MSTTVPTPTGDGGTLVATRERRLLLVRGIVQGVGFRPFVWRLAGRHGLGGFVRNTSGSVAIEVEGEAASLDAFAAALTSEAPRLARIDAVESAPVAAVGETRFRIEESRSVAGEYQPVSPDAATCDDCLRELLDPADRRFRYPFVNCTNCGPRFTIIEDIPYDRPLTTMRRFTMCARCRAEYEDPNDRRFHAQPNACPACGPRLWAALPDGTPLPGDALAVAAAAFAEGRIVAVKALGGYQLACDAGDEDVVQRLRERKRRPSKPFALIVADIDVARRVCLVDPAEAALLSSPARPVVLMRRRAEATPAVVAEGIAPGLGELGLMLPSTPLHHLLMRDTEKVLVMTSGNASEEPIAKDDAEAVERLGGIADVLLLHDRDIHARYDDSVVRFTAAAPRTVRRARGLCPVPVVVDGAPDGDVLALGGHLKNTYCVLRGTNAFVGPHVGDLDDPLTLAHQEESLGTYLRLFRATPRTVACDLHPDYATTRMAERWWDGGAHPVRVQHHHAHVASVMAEHGLRGRLLGVAFDGTGYGPDGTVWGGEILLCDESSYRRVGHLGVVAQPGGDVCAREGWRMAASYLVAAGEASERPPAWMAGEDGALPDPRRWRLVTRLAAGSRPAGGGAGSPATPLTSSAGRLFDAVASLLGVAHDSSYEAEAAMRLEALAATAADAVDAVPVAMTGDPLRLDAVGLVAAVVAARRAGRPAAECAALLHESLAVAVTTACARLATEHGIRRVALSGGVFQNALLLERTTDLLAVGGLEVYANAAVPANDGGISLGQALVAASLRRSAMETPR